MSTFHLQTTARTAASRWNSRPEFERRIRLVSLFVPLFFALASLQAATVAATATFVKADTSTQGNWRSAYGSDGYMVAGDLISNPSYVAPVISGSNYWIWNSATSDVRAPQRASNPSTRVAATWYASGQYLIDLSVTDSAQHQVALYCVDWDSTGRRQTVEVLDANNNVLNTQTLSNSFTGGVYLVWNVTGHVTLRITWSGGANAVVSGIYFGPPASGGTGTSATFLKTDTTTSGNWGAAYGSEGYMVAGDLVSNPSYVAPVMSGANYWVWNSSPSDVRAPQRPSNPSNRVAATWYASGQYLIDLNVTDGAQHQVALYCVDWDSTGRRQTVDVLDANNNVLNTQTLSSSFTGGVYLVWNVTGHVKLRLTWTGGANAVASGLFFGGAGIQIVSPPIIITAAPTITTTVSPTSTSLLAAQTQQFTATVSGTSNTAVTWTTTIGSISNTGLYTAPSSVTSQQTSAVTATSAADTTKSASATITLTPKVAVTVSPLTQSLVAGGTQLFTSTVTGTTNGAVTWSVSSTSAPGAISSAGMYTAPTSVSSPQTVTVTATSVADTTKSASAAVTVSAPSNASVSISSPAASSKISGTVTFAVSLQNSGAVASVDYLLNGKSISGPLTSAPYSFVWPSASVWDGQMSVKAIARDILGNVLATSASLPFQIANGTSTLTLVSPNPSQVLSGVVNWTLNTNWNLSSGNPIYFFFLDGQQVWLTFTKTQTITYSLDTTKIPNGTHELYCALYAEQPSSISPPLAMSQVQVQVNNGHAVQQLRSNWRQIVLQPGQTAVLSPQWVYTDGVGTQSTTASYVSANSSVATVNSGGLVQAVAPGVTTLTATSGSYSDTTRVLVTSAATLPHFAKNGQFLNAYDPVNSTYVRSMFWLDNTEIQQTPGTAARMQEAALNTITNGFFYNPVDNSNNSTFAAWKPGMDILLNGLQQAAVTNNFNLFLTGDDIARHPNELSFSLNNTWSPNPVQYAFQWTQSSGHVIGVDMVDEINFGTGNTPTPSDGRSCCPIARRFPIPRSRA